ncbi:MAG: 50S ribosomal protein L11 methyltransferase [Pseudomonadota bacterium]
MSGHKLTIVLGDRSTAHSIAAVLEEAVDSPPDALSIFEDGPQWTISAHYEFAAPEPDVLSQQVGDLLGIAPPAARVEAVPDLNWVAISQSALPPVFAGRFTVHGDHDRDHVQQGPNSILINAGEAFGTAHHATTYGCLLALDRITRRQRFDTVLDLGTGSGVLALAARTALPHADILATDIDEQSVVVAKENAAMNGCGRFGPRRIDYRVADGVSRGGMSPGRSFELVIANILAGPLLVLAPDIARVSQRGGKLLLSGILIEQAAAVIARYCSLGFALASHDRIEGWSTLEMTKAR